jgi:DNA repair photolyase
VPQVEYRSIVARSAINRVQGMPFRWSLNPYRGCTHACHYCYARVTHAHFNLNAGHDFERIIFVKENLPEVLRLEISRRSWQCESIAIGTATDPYQPAEAHFRITRRCLEVLANRQHPCTITTKGTLAVRDIDVMQSLAASTSFAVYLSLATLDRDLARRLEPGTAPPKSRLRLLERLASAGIKTSVLLMPIIPGISDRPEQLRAVIEASAAAGAVGVHAAVLRLAPGIKDWFEAFVDREFPHLAKSYARGYARGANVPASYQQSIDRRVAEASVSAVFRPMPERESTVLRQLSLC